MAVVLLVQAAVPVSEADRGQRRRSQIVQFGAPCPRGWCAIVQALGLERERSARPLGVQGLLGALMPSGQQTGRDASN